MRLNHLATILCSSNIKFNDNIIIAHINEVKSSMGITGWLIEFL